MAIGKKGSAARPAYAGRPPILSPNQINMNITTKMTHNGKIGRLPHNIREELNQRLENGQSARPILQWLNALPEVQDVLASRFSGSRISEQNLTNWRQGGYLQWLKQQERREIVRELTENAADLAADSGGVEVANHLFAVLVAELAAAARDALAATTNPAELCALLQQILQTLARVRRQDYLAGRLAIDRELRERDRPQEKEEAEEREEEKRESEPRKLFSKRASMTDLYAQADLLSQALANAQAESLLRRAKPDHPVPNGSHAPGSPGPN